MATSNQAAWQTLRSKLLATGLLRTVTIGEPSLVSDGVTCAILATSATVDETTLQSPRELHTTALRFYGLLSDDNREQMEFDLDAIRANIQADMFGDFDLGGTVAYLQPTAFTATWGFLQVGQSWCRILEIPVTYRVDDRATFVA